MDREDGTHPLPEGFHVGGGGVALREQLAFMKSFLDSFDFVHLRPSREVVRRGIPDGAAVHALGRNGREYAIYISGGQDVARLGLGLPAGRYRLTWYDPKTGRVTKRAKLEHDGGEATVVSPSYSEDLGARDPIRQNVVTPALAARAVVLVEGISDQRALEALARRRGRNLAAERVSIVPTGGAQAIGSFLDRFGPQGLNLRLAGLCDAGEEGDYRRGLERAGHGSNLTRADLERLGFYVCDADLEDELIRALGAVSVEQVVGAQGELGSFRTLQKQPAWQGRPIEEQLRRFMGSGGSRKIRTGRLLVDALDLTQVPRPLDQVLAHVWRTNV